jgi:hypothetical protein
LIQAGSKEHIDMVGNSQMYCKVRDYSDVNILAHDVTSMCSVCTVISGLCMLLDAFKIQDNHTASHLYDYRTYVWSSRQRYRTTRQSRIRGSGNVCTLAPHFVGETSLAPSGAFLFPGPYQSSNPYVMLGRCPVSLSRLTKSVPQGGVVTRCCFPPSASLLIVSMSSCWSLITLRFDVIPTYD